MNRVARALPVDVALLGWLAGELGVAQSTVYRLASAGELAEFGVFKIGSQYRVSKPKALRRIHDGADSRPT